MAATTTAHPAVPEGLDPALVVFERSVGLAQAVAVAVDHLLQDDVLAGLQ